MTAFARLTEASRQGSWSIEIRSVNHRFLDLSLRLPAALASLEDGVRQELQALVRRGKVSVNIFQDCALQNGKKVSFNEELIDFYLKRLRKIQRRYHLADGISVADLLKIPGIFEIESSEENPQRIWPALKKLLKKAAAELIRMKEKEGQKLLADIEYRLEQIGRAVSKIERSSAGTPERVFKKLRERVGAFLEEKSKDDDRFYREVAFLAEKSDVTEEIVRLRSHLQLFRDRLRTETEIGRELDFLCQEMNREVNTMGSKSQFFEISTEVVFIKGELEKIREQIQNIE